MVDGVDLEMPALVPDTTCLQIKSSTDGFAFLFRFPPKTETYDSVVHVTDIVTLTALTYLSLKSNHL